MPYATADSSDFLAQTTENSTIKVDVTPPEHQPQTIDRQLLLIENNVSAEDAQNYHIAIPRKAKAGEPCLTITWKTNPDGSGPDYPRIYMADGYFRIMPPSIPSIPSMSRDQPQ
ncbi:GL22725 [Drosophila persimilis]|uniref:GL22725 n=1 Tax=Drosophila persimilis TaxID=7234 RepID=B4GZT8_DROPE|nr:GL22725 [Drosophila persimilis]